MDSAEATQPQDTPAQPDAAHAAGSDTAVSPPPAPAATPAAEPVEVDVDGERMLTVPVHAFKRIKDDARTKGRLEAMDELTTRLQALAKQGGFDSFEAALGALAKLNAGAGANTATTTPADTAATADDDPPEPSHTTASATDDKAKRAPTPAAASAAEKLDADWAKERERLRRRLDHETETRKAAEARASAMEAAAELRIAAVRAGVEDVDFAMHLAGKHLSTADDTALAAFNAATWFESLRKERPALFAAQRRVVETGNTRNDEAGTALSAADAARASNEAGKTDANRMTREQFATLLMERGLRPPTVGTPLS